LAGFLKLFSRTGAFCTEHRLFSVIRINWRGKPLRSYRTIVELIAATITDTGLKIRAELDEK
jgi:hypothetical protein